MSITLTAAAVAAAQDLGVLDSGEPLTTQQLADALFKINNRLDNWSTEQSMVAPILLVQGTLSAGNQARTIGAGQQINTARPIAILAAVNKNPLYGVSLDTPIKVCTAIEWAQIADRGNSGPLVKYLFYDRGFATGSVYFSPIPLGGTVELTVWSPLTQFADATTPITVPPGYQELYQMAIAVIIAGQFSVQVPDSVQRQYDDCIARIRNNNAGIVAAMAPGGQTSAVLPAAVPIPTSGGQ